MKDIDRSDIDRLAESLTNAWNAADGPAFAHLFTEEADFVTIYAMHVIGRDAIAQQHQTIFDGVYRDSRIAFHVVKTRAIADVTAIALIKAELHVPQGPMAGDMHTLATAVLVRAASQWSIAAFQNTREQVAPALPVR